MNAPGTEYPELPPHVVRQSCSPACAAYRLLKLDRWPDFGVCLNPFSLLCGYPCGSATTGRISA